MRPEPMENRDDELRRALVATVDLAPFARTARAARTIVTAIAVFALAGALTGGAIAVAATTKAPGTAAAFDLQTEGQQRLIIEDATLVDKPIARSGVGDLTVPLGVAPGDATGLVIAFECADGGDYTTSLDSKVVVNTKCHVPPKAALGLDTSSGVSGDGFAASDGVYAVSTGTLTASSEVLTTKSKGRHTLRITAPRGARYSLWIAWAALPSLLESAAQKADLIDGTVTRAEYLAAYNRFAGCMAALGYPLPNSSQDATVIPIHFPDPNTNPRGAGVGERCYQTELGLVAHQWEFENPEPRS